MWTCPNGHKPEKVIAILPSDLDPDGTGVFVSADTGAALDEWADGRKGVPSDLRNFAEKQYESPECPECGATCEREDITAEITNSEDVIDSRDVIARIAELEREQRDLAGAVENAQAALDAFESAGATYEGELPIQLHVVNLNDAVTDAKAELESWGLDYANELECLKELVEACQNHGDWEYGATLIRDSYFEDYARETAKDIGAITDDEQWPATCIDWERATVALQQDYSRVNFGGEDYWIRS